MRRFLLFCLMVMASVAAAFVSAAHSSADDSSRLNKEAGQRLDALDKLRKEKVQVAEQRYKAVMSSFDAGTEVLANVYAASIGWKDAEYEVAKTALDRRKVLERHSGRMSELYKRIHGLNQVAARGGESDKVETAHFWELEAKVWVLQE
jgi:hypothetical protein